MLSVFMRTQLAKMEGETVNLKKKLEEETTIQIELKAESKDLEK